MAILKNWTLLFKFQYGYDNRMLVLKNFIDFMNNEERTWVPPGHCILGGNIYENDKFPNEEPILTSKIEFISKKEKAENIYGIGRTLLRATTNFGDEYIFRSDDYSPYMFLLMGDYTHLKLLSLKPDRYVPKEFRARGLL